MKLFLITLFGLLGNFAIDAVPQATVQPPTKSQSMDWNLYLNKLQNKAQLVQDMKNDLNSASIDKNLNDETEKINDYSATYSTEVQQLVSNIRPSLLTAHDSIIDAISIMHGWCSGADILLAAFLDTFPSNDIATRDETLKDLFDSDSSTEIMNKLKEASDMLGSASSLVSNISSEFDSDSTERSPLFQELLRHEILSDENKQYPARLVEKILEQMQEYIDHPDLLELVLSKTNLAGAVAISVLRSHANQEAPPTTHQTPKETTVDPQTYVRFRDRVLHRFKSTKNFFIAYKSSIDRAISSIDEINAKVLRNNQPAAAMGNVQPQYTPNNQRITDARLKNAAKALKNNCQKFSNAQI
ncbi:uncharacterized protein LOC108047263 [Drosophila rhopaloa]|uniref:Uncharacterized protein LOC108047263 n=1 Tax=Drosophila rhopaloa TaxID=1041015 RepID=A0A6P4FBK1_DRORH|nr:uncharacterized protein LOC108047263 [Drosophila rhopaloa]